MSAPTRDKRYTLRQPCNNCPFRTDITPYLRPDRAAEIAQHLRDGGEFVCHKTTVDRDDDEGVPVLADDPASSRMCAGAMATMEREGQPNQMMRVAERLGLYDATQLRTDLVHPTLTDWVRSFRDPRTVTTGSGEVVEFEHCGVVADGCEDPAGFGGSYGVYGNDAEPTCNPDTDSCWACGSTACEACRSDEWDDNGQYCRYCSEANAEDDE